MDRQQEATAIVSELDSIIKEFKEKTPKEAVSDEKIAIRRRNLLYKLLDLQKAADDVMRDIELSCEGITQEDIDLLKSYLEQVKSLTR